MSPGLTELASAATAGATVGGIIGGLLLGSAFVGVGVMVYNRRKAHRAEEAHAAAVAAAEASSGTPAAV